MRPIENPQTSTTPSKGDLARRCGAAACERTFSKSAIFLSLVLFFASCGAPAATKTSEGAEFGISPEVLSERADTLIDIGRMKEGEVVQFNSAIRNSGSEPLVITAVRAACGCTAVEYERQPILPNESGNFSFRFDSRGMWGVQLKLIEISTSAGPDYRITVKAEVE